MLHVGSPANSAFAFHMRTILRPVLLVMFLTTLPAAAGANPAITSLSPTSGAVGASVTISGSAFGATQGSSTVKFNNTTATSITSWTDTSIVAVVPPGATTGGVVVKVSNKNSNSVTFTVVAAPSITNLTPNSGAVGASVTIAGQNFGNPQGSGTVNFNGTAATVTSWNASSIVVIVPSSATTGNVIVRASGVNSNGVSFTVAGTPTLTSLSPTSGGIGASIVLSGANFGGSQGSGSVKFNGTTATVTNWTASSITAMVPASASTGPVVVHASGVDTNGQAFTVVPPPVLTSLSPTSGAVASPVTITGLNFGATQGTSTVKFNGVLANVVSWGATSIRVSVPGSATSGTVVVRVGGVDSNGVSFAVGASPSITSLSPTSGPVGTLVTISGANFGASQSGGSVRFGTKSATLVSWSATSIVAMAPTGANGNLVVHAGGANSNGVPFNLLSTLVGATATAKHDGTAYLGGANALLQRPGRNPAAPRGLEVQMSWFHINGTLFAVDRFTLSDVAAIPDSGVHDSVVTNIPPPWRIVVHTRETLGEVADMTLFSCNSDKPYSGQATCTTDDLPAPTGPVLGEATTEVTVASIP